MRMKSEAEKKKGLMAKRMAGVSNLESLRGRSTHEVLKRNGMKPLVGNDIRNK